MKTFNRYKFNRYKLTLKDKQGLEIASTFLEYSSELTRNEKLKKVREYLSRIGYRNTKFSFRLQNETERLQREADLLFMENN